MCAQVYRSSRFPFVACAALVGLGAGVNYASCCEGKQRGGLASGPSGRVWEPQQGSLTVRPRLQLNEMGAPLWELERPGELRKWGGRAQNSRLMLDYALDAP
ncbi:hypothetical protein BDK51DRAFT_30033 [Blyttiomyces helicus]|uniref:Uncharacterized protein n=1 Tax=Blyttiomyces helicus TaxID=388810 RepID=A0A4P9WJK9_9FUNG|nr:hypothetical protein BDK51DRAFT_30033 [Blyttiomyces helicus]|eukprot:RKO92552.1 hypothetical protein BDK51DRAFT_30033 [Blyttiomyces helicus]